MATTPEFVALREDDNCGASSHLVLQTLFTSHHPVTLEETLEDFEVSHEQGINPMLPYNLVAPLSMPPQHPLEYTLVFSLCA